jgi:hypothetical protein
MTSKSDVEGSGFMEWIRRTAGLLNFSYRQRCRSGLMDAFNKYRGGPQKLNMRARVPKRLTVIHELLPALLLVPSHLRKIRTLQVWCSYITEQTEA